MAKQRLKPRRAQGQSANRQNDNAQPRERCPGRGGAKKAARVYAGDFYAGPVLLEGTRRGVRYKVEEPSGDAATSAPGGGAVLFTPPQRCAPGNSTATSAAVALRCAQSQTMLNVRGNGQRGAALLRQATYRIQDTELRSHNPTPPEVLAQARPPAATPMGARQGGARNVRCTDFGGASGDHGGPRPMRVSPPPPPHTHVTI